MGKTRRKNKFNEDDYFTDRGNKKPRKKRRKNKDWSNYRNVPSEEVLEDECEDEME
jgi:hypothetical protein